MGRALEIAFYHSLNVSNRAGEGFTCRKIQQTKRNSSPMHPYPKKFKYGREQMGGGKMNLLPKNNKLNHNLCFSFFFSLVDFIMELLLAKRV